MAKDLKESGSSGSKDRMKKMVKKRYEGGGLRKTEDGWDRYEGISYEKKGKYKGGLDKQTDRTTKENTYTQYKPLRKPVESKNRTGHTVITYGKGKEISEKKYNRVKKRRSKKYKNTEY
jgi:hypothetical protein